MHIVIFSGYNQRAVIAFLRTLTKNGLFNYSIIARDCEDTILKTQYKDKVFCVRDSKELYVMDILNLIVQLIEQSNSEYPSHKVLYCLLHKKPYLYIGSLKSYLHNPLL